METIIGYVLSRQKAATLQTPELPDYTTMSEDERIAADLFNDIDKAIKAQMAHMQRAVRLEQQWGAW